MKDDELLRKFEKLLSENKRLRHEIHKLKMQLNKSLLLEDANDNYKDDSQEKIVKSTDDTILKNNLVDKKSNKIEKIKLYQSLFRGRNDVCAKQWSNGKGYSPFCYNEWVSNVCPKKQKSKFKCIECSNQNLAKLDYKNIESHLRGEHFLGIYPLTKDDTCCFVAIDFDESDWCDTLKAVLCICTTNNISAYPEISKSGDGAHLWFFFNEEIKASIARKFASEILTETMESYKNISMSSYDRLFPSQDFLQKDGFGNLIALPLNGKHRKLNLTEFVDKDLNVIDDQWHYLSQVRMINKDIIEKYLNSRNTNLEQICSDQLEFKFSNISLKNQIYSESDFPKQIILEKSSGIIIDKSKVSAKVLHSFRKWASFSNPEFFSKQKMRMSTYNTPRYIEVFKENKDYLWMPRGTYDQIIKFLEYHQVDIQINDRTNHGNHFNIEFSGNLRTDQLVAFKKLIDYQTGVLCATTGFGKTVISAAIIAEKKVNTLILVHTRQLADQWITRLEEFLKLPESIIDQPSLKRGRKKHSRKIGLLGGGKNNLTSIVDIAIMQSVYDNKEVKSLVKEYGLVIVDECHHVSASSFNEILSEVNAHFVYGLTATPIRKDGHHPNIFMQCGPIRHIVDPKVEAQKRSFEHYIIPRFTSFRKPLYQEEKEWHISSIYKAICEDEFRNIQIVEDIIGAVSEGRRPIILTERTDHVDRLAQILNEEGIECICLTGRLSAKDRKGAFTRLNEFENNRSVIVATGKLVGEGFDLPSLDTLFLAMPVAWKGTIAQYVGRLHREFEGKNEVRVYDYIDVRVSILEKMYYKRLKGYKLVGYSLKESPNVETSNSSFFTYEEAMKQISVDISYAKKSIYISTPKINLSKLIKWLPLFEKKCIEGVRIIVYTDPLDYNNENAKQDLKNIFKVTTQKGINIRYARESCKKIISVDDKVVWFGDLNIFGYNDSSSSAMKLTEAAIVNELVDVIGGIEYNE